MKRESDAALAKKVFKEYSAFLDANGIRYNDHQGFYVYADTKNMKHSFTHVCEPFDGEVLITDYCGNCYTGIRAANRVVKAIQSRFPDCDIRPEKYGGAFEIEIYHSITFKNIEDLHEHVLRVAKAADEGAGIGYEMLGKSFDR